MIEAFSAQAMPPAGTAPGPGLWLSLAVLVALAACGLWRWSGRKLSWFVVLFIAVIGVFGVAVPGWDQFRLRQMLANDEGLTVTQGVIVQTWHIEDRRRDYASSMKNNYKTVVSEGFDVASPQGSIERFSWVVGQCLSAVALCDLSVLGTPPAKGQSVEVTWFADPAQQGERRILRLRVGPPPLSGAT